MTITAAPPVAQAAGPSARRTVPFWVWLAAGWLIQVAVRRGLSWGITVPRAYPDEAGYLIAARLMTGGPGADFSGGTLYQGGYPLLLVPVYAVAHDPETVYRCVLLVNALVGALLMPLLYAGGRRLGLRRWPAYAVAMSGALLPQVAMYAASALTDAVLPVVILGWLLCLHTWLVRGHPGAAVGASLLAAYAYAVHSRGEVVLAVHVVAAAFILARGWTRTPWAALAPLVPAVAGAYALNAWLTARLYPGGVRDLTGNLLGHLVTPDGRVRMLAQTAGQLWSLATDSWGLGAIGLIVAVLVVVRPVAPRDLRVLAAVALATTVLIAVASSGALPDEHRVGDYAQARYLSCFTAVYFLIGASVLADRFRRGRRVGSVPFLAAAALAAVCGTVCAVLAGGRLRTDVFIGSEFVEPSTLTGDWTGLNLPLATAVTCALVLAAGLAARRVALVGAVLLSLTALYGYTTRTQLPAEPHYRALALTVRPGEPVALDTRLYWQTWLPAMWADPAALTHRYDARSRPPPPQATAVEVPWDPGVPPRLSWPSAPPGWRVAATDRDFHWVLWRRPG